LVARQDRDGGWQGDVPKDGGTPLITLALLNAGVSLKDVNSKDEKVRKRALALQRALKWLRDNPATQTYGVALETMVFCFVNDKADRKRIEKNVAVLLAYRRSEGWTYGDPLRGGGSPPDNSNTQYALLALHEAIQRGVNVDRKVLVEVRDYF